MKPSYIKKPNYTLGIVEQQGRRNSSWTAYLDIYMRRVCLFDYCWFRFPVTLLNEVETDVLL